MVRPAREQKVFESNKIFSAARMVKARAMALKAVVSDISKSAKDQELLEEDQRWIGCHGLMGKPWGLHMEDLVVELLGEKDNQWHGTVRNAPEKWTAKEWRKVYGFAREGKGMASRTDRFIDGKFSERVNCEHYRQYHRLVVLFFLVFSKFLLDISSSRVKRWQTRFILS